MTWAGQITSVTSQPKPITPFASTGVTYIHVRKKLKKLHTQTLVRPSIEYASAVWDPFNKKQISQLDCTTKSCTICFEQLSRPRTRSSYIYNLQLKMGITWTKVRKGKSVLMYKIVHNLFEIHAEHLLIPADSRTRGIAAFRTIYTLADIYRFSFFPCTIITWNSIPPDVRQASTIGQFQAELGSITLPVQSQV